MVSPTTAVDKLADANRRRFLQARLWGREGHAKRASWFLGPLLAESPDNPVVIYFAAEALMANDEAGKALDLWTRGAARHPEATGLLAERARFYGQRKLWDKAEKDLAAVIAKVQAPRDPMMDLAALYGHRDWMIDRCLALQAVVDKWADDRQALAELGRCKLDRGYAEEAEKLVHRASALAPGEPSLLHALFDLAERRLDHGAAEAHLRELGAARPDAPEVSFLAADLARRQGKRDEARHALEEARDRAPDAPFAYARLAQLALEAGDSAGAERWWRLALERDPENSALAQRLAALSPNALPLGDRLAPTAEEIDRAVRSADKVAVHPGSHTVVLLDDEVTTVHPDGSSKRIVTQVMQAVTADGRDALIQAHLPASGRVNVIEAYAIKKGGERQDAASITGGVVRFRGLDVGSITVVKYAHFAPPPHFLPNEYASEWRFQEVNAQVEDARWRLVLPRERALNVESRGQISRSEEVVGDEKVVTLAAHHVPPLVPEPGMPPVIDELWTAGVSTLKTWDGYARWEAALLGEALQGGPEIDALAKKLTADAKTPREKLDRLWAHVAQEIRYQQDYEDTIAGVKPHSASQVVERGYGDCKDKAVLLIRLARAVGVELRFALLRTSGAGKAWQGLPNQQFNHAIVYAPRQTDIDEPLFIDTTTNGLDIGNMRTDDEGSWRPDPRPGFRAGRSSPSRTRARISSSCGRTSRSPSPTRRRRSPTITSRPAGPPPRASAWRCAAPRARRGTTSASPTRSSPAPPSSTASPTTGRTSPCPCRSTSTSTSTTPSAARTTPSAWASPSPSPPPTPPPLPPATTRSASGVASRRPRRRSTSARTSRPPTCRPTSRSSTPASTLTRKAETKAEPAGTKVIVRSTYRNTCAEIAPADYPAFRAAVERAVAHTQDALVFGPKQAAPKK